MRQLLLFSALAMLSFTGAPPDWFFAHAEQAFPADPPQPSAEPSPKIPLIQASFPGTQWRFYSAKKDALFEETWRILPQPEPVLICTGTPDGYIRTTQSYQNFELHLEWKFPKDPHGNSGILLYMPAEDRIWPTSVQVQLYRPEAGHTFAIGGAKSDNELRNGTGLSKPTDEWNQCLIRSRDGVVTVTINGQNVGEITGCQPRQGSIGLQSEGSEIHFRRMWIRELPASFAVPDSPMRVTKENPQPAPEQTSSPSSEEDAPPPTSPSET